MGSCKHRIMSGKGSGKSASYSGVNSQGDSYTCYSDGGYSYKNASGSSYYNTGSGHGFYNSGSKGTQSSNGTPYTTHYNYNQGTQYPVQVDKTNIQLRLKMLH